MTARTFRPEIFLVSLAAILLEIGYTRVFSYKLHYYFVFLTIGIALLGLGAGGVLVAVSERLRAARDETLVGVCTIAAALGVPTGYLAIAMIQINAVDASEQLVELLKLVGVALLLFLPFLAIGIVLARIFSARPDDLPRLYFSDLMGAGLGCALCVPLFASVGPPSAILLGGAVLALAGLRLAVTWRPAWLEAPLAALLAAGALMSWAVNGFFSVMSSVLATMVSMTFGFRGVLLQALLSYAIAVFALTRIPAPRQSI